MSVVIRLFTGPHMGAELVLEPGVSTLGSSLDCDIVLHDSSIAPRHLELRVEASPVSVWVTPLDGDVLIAGEPIAANTELPPRTPCFAGLTCLAWASPEVPLAFPDASSGTSAGETDFDESSSEKDEHAPSETPDLRVAWNEVTAALRPLLHPVPASESEPSPAEEELQTQNEQQTDSPSDGESSDPSAPEDDESTEPSDTILLKVDGSTANDVVLNRLAMPSHHQTRNLRIRRALTLLLLLLLLSGLVFKVRQELDKPVQSLEEIQHFLKEAGFSTLSVVESDEGPVVSGRLPDDIERGRLLRLVQRMQLPVYLNVQVDGDMTQALAAAFTSRELFPKVWPERDGERIRLHVSGYIKDGVVEAWAFAGASEDLPWLEPFLHEGTEPSPGTLIRSILHADDVELALRPALEAAGLGKTQATYLPGTIEISGVFDVEGRNRLDRTLESVRERLAIPILFQIREVPPQLPQSAANKVTGMHPDKTTPSSNAASSPAPIGQETMTFRVTGVTMTPMRFITLESGERVFEGGTLPGGYLLESISSSRLTLRRGGQTTLFTLRGSDEH